VAALLRPRLLADLARRGGERLAERARALAQAQARMAERAADRVHSLGARLVPALARALSDAGRAVARGRADLAALDARLQAASAARLRSLALRLDALERTRQTLGYAQTLRRGFAVVRGDGAVVTSRTAAERAAALEIEFHDGRLRLGAAPAKGRKTSAPPDQGSLF